MSVPGDSAADVASWVGSSRMRVDVLSRSAAARLAATLDLAARPPAVGEALPPLWHWLYFLPDAPQSALADTGHPRRGDFLPPVALARRMYAGGRLEFFRPLRVGDDARCTSTITAIEEKDGSSGLLVIVTVRHEIEGDGGVAIVEEQDIIYTDGPPLRPPQTSQDPPSGAWERTIVPDEALLFRFSALTFNAHRIHYDREYARAAGYSDLVVHGPLAALSLAELARTNGAAIGQFSFRARRPLFVNRPLHLRGGPGGDMAAYDDGGEPCVTASFA